MKQEVNPKETCRAQAFEMWMKSPVPMVTLTKTFDVTHLRKVCKRRNLKFNMLLCWCMGRVASQKEEFYLRGAIDYRTMGFKHRLMMKFMHARLAKMPKESLNAESRIILETYGQCVDYVDFSALEAIRLKL